MDKSPDAFRTISETADELDVPQHVLRFWESRFSQIKPMKRAGGRRLYGPEDIALIRGIRSLLYNDGYTIRGVQRILKTEGAAYVCGVGRGEIVAKTAEPEEHEELPLAAESLGGDRIEMLKSALIELSEARQLLAE